MKRRIRRLRDNAKMEGGREGGREGKPAQERIKPNEPDTPDGAKSDRMRPDEAREGQRRSGETNKIGYNQMGSDRDRMRPGAAGQGWVRKTDQDSGVTTMPVCRLRAII
ncbi:hypothetical protein DSM19430T_12160 [Desulfovibrio psychrotolerans]|uniref:Uncharacterized protein n=1 Tax=Desulfovibrio psychrotolerans TaxID=415242 RepID=A0A7J0BTP9_9BACT|nr:hypothetical protein DSM19430T_12160 [Desulfovibrio psychrotolerans]